MENSEIEFKKLVEAGGSKKRNRNKTKNTLEEFTFFKEEDHLLFDVSSTESAVDKTINKGSEVNYTQQEENYSQDQVNYPTKQEEGSHPQLNNTSNENGVNFVDNIKYEPGTEGSEVYNQEADDNPEDPLVNDESKSIEYPAVFNDIRDEKVITPSFKKRRAKKEKNLVCDKCGRKFAYKLNLKNHKQIHTVEKPYDW